MKSFLLLLTATLLLSAPDTRAQNAVIKNAKTDTPRAPFRVIGYLLETSIEHGNTATFDLSRVNYLNIAFINPDSTGKFPQLPRLDAFIAAAHAKNVKVLASIGGGSAPAYYTALLSDSMRNNVIRNAVTFVTENQLDGIDVDLEGARIDSNYERFVTGLSVALKQQNKLLTAAVATGYKSRYPDKALTFFDFINIMSYDRTGPWRPTEAGPHSPYEMAVDDLDYWRNVRGIAKEKLSLGLPFYGYGFSGAPTELSYGTIVSRYPGSEGADSVSVAGGGIIYYNGIPTITAKTNLALQKAGGIMIWQLMQDADGNNSLLDTINAAIRSAAGH